MYISLDFNGRALLREIQFIKCKIKFVSEKKTLKLTVFQYIKIILIFSIGLISQDIMIYLHRSDAVMY